VVLGAPVKTLIPLLLALVGACHLSPAQEANRFWPAWRGPLANGVAPEANPPVTWSETNNLKWKVKLPGRGTSTPIVWENQVFVLTAMRAETSSAGQPAPQPPPAARSPQIGDGQGRSGFTRSEKPIEPWRFVVMSLDRATGKTLWQHIARELIPHEGHHQDHGFASYSPVTDGQRLYVSFGSRGLHCYDLKGTRLWEKDLGQMQTRNSFGEGSSPALAGSTLVLNWDHEGEDFVAAFDKETGRELWRQPRDENTSWATPLVVPFGGQTQVVISATTKIKSYDLATGRLIWECAGMTQNVIPSPVAADGVVYPISGFRGSSLMAIKLGRTGDLTDTDAILWKHTRSTPYVPSPLLYDDRLYFFAVNNGVFSCVDRKTGKVVVDARRFEALQGVYASPMGAANRIYLVGRNGAAVVLKKNDSLDLLATNRLEDKFDSSPAAVGRQLFLRGRDHLYCLAEP
jgi:outer membrane protein assembly factor BamB